MDLESSRYRPIADELARRIRAGELKEGDQLPSIPELMKAHEISNGVARKVLRTLVSEGLATAKAGAGTYVRRRPAIRRIVRSWHNNARRGGLPGFSDDDHAIGSVGYESRTVEGSLAVRERLDLDPLDQEDRPDLMRTTYLREVAGEPVFIETSWEPLQLTRDTVIAFPEDGPHGGKGVVERMRHIGIEVTHAPEVVSARPSTAEEARQLGVAPGDIVLVIERTHYADTRPVETADIVIPVDRYQVVYGTSIWDEPAG
ncbi:GntR family transcriptional regulator [Nonomuraea lactucae]|uniref:GntR family transcriptional regulator n=1 Tax=Nonomuraea lactucae TaxID=2249762 RepID=UPI0013B3EBCD|nr:GntR family transcriptional regulator [Nonomuraea lactucae]